MIQRTISILCLIALMTPGFRMYAQDESVPEKKPEESKIIDTAPAAETVTKGVEVDSLKHLESFSGSLSVAPALPLSDTPEVQVEEEIPEYKFKGTGRDIVIGAAVLTGWFVVAFIAANQKSE